MSESRNYSPTEALVIAGSDMLRYTLHEYAAMIGRTLVRSSANGLQAFDDQAESAYVNRSTWVEAARRSNRTSSSAHQAWSHIARHQLQANELSTPSKDVAHIIQPGTIDILRFVDDTETPVTSDNVLLSIPGIKTAFDAEKLGLPMHGTSTNGACINEVLRELDVIICDSKA